MILYPAYAGAANWESYVEAMRKTANYFSIPCLDLSSEMGISIYSDTQCLYWRGNYGQFCDRNPHPTQECADVIAECVSNYIYSHFSQ